MFWLVTLVLQGANIYVSQTTQGGDTGANCANAHSASWLSTAANWSGISPGDTIHFCGPISTTLTNHGSGTPGNAITMLFEPGASLSQAASTLAYCQNASNIVWDGGTGLAVIENTANGTGLANSNGVSGIYASGSRDLEIRNFTMRNFYVHTSTNDAAPYAFDSQGALYMNGFGNNISVHNCSFSNICWVLNFQGGTGVGINIYRSIPL